MFINEDNGDQFDKDFRRTARYIFLTWALTTIGILALIGVGIWGAITLINWVTSK